MRDIVRRMDSSLLTMMLLSERTVLIVSEGVLDSFKKRALWDMWSNARSGTFECHVGS